MAILKWHGKQYEKWLVKNVIIPKLLKACLVVLAEAKRLMANEGPLHAVDTGRLMNSLAHEVDEGNLLGRVGTDVEYAIYVFLGTSKMAPRPVLRTALANMRGEIQAILS